MKSSFFSHRALHPWEELEQNYKQQLETRKSCRQLSPSDNLILVYYFVCLLSFNSAVRERANYETKLYKSAKNDPFFLS